MLVTHEEFEKVYNYVVLPHNSKTVCIILKSLVHNNIVLCFTPYRKLS